MTHHHKGKSSEGLLDKGIILQALNILPNFTVLDAGCGDGYMSKEFSRILNNTGKVYALDPDGEAIEELQKEVRGTNIQAMEGDVTKRAPLGTSSIDLIYLSMVFHGFSKQQVQDFQEEAKRLLKPRARLAIVEIHKQSTPFGPPMDIRFSPGELKQVVVLTPLTTVEIGQYFYMQLFEHLDAN